MDQQNCCYYSYDCRNNCPIDQGLFENKVVRLNETTPRTTLKGRRTTDAPPKSRAGYATATKGVAKDREGPSIPFQGYPT